MVTTRATTDSDNAPPTFTPISDNSQPREVARAHRDIYEWAVRIHRKLSIVGDGDIDGGTP